MKWLCDIISDPDQPREKQIISDVQLIFLNSIIFKIIYNIYIVDLHIQLDFFAQK